MQARIANFLESTYENLPSPTDFFDAAHRFNSSPLMNGLNTVIKKCAGVGGTMFAIRTLVGVSFNTEAKYLAAALAAPVGLVFFACNEMLKTYYIDEQRSKIKDYQVIINDAITTINDEVYALPEQELIDILSSGLCKTSNINKIIYGATYAADLISDTVSNSSAITLHFIIAIVFHNDIAELNKDTKDNIRLSAGVIAMTYALYGLIGSALKSRNNWNTHIKEQDELRASIKTFCTLFHSSKENSKLNDAVTEWEKKFTEVKRLSII